MTRLRRVVPLFVACVACVACTGCAAQPGAEPVPERPIELAPGLRIDRAARTVEFDGLVPIDAHNDETPDVFLELLVTGPDSREHESLVVTHVRPSLIHAALLSVGLEPGKPGRVAWDTGTAVRTPSTGAPVDVLVSVLQEGEWTLPVALVSWVISQDRRTRLIDAKAWTGVVFAGSVSDLDRGVPYVADATGTIIGLATFGTEVIAPRLTLSHEARVDAPVWVADRARTPLVNTPVRVIVKQATLPGSEAQ
ncbi:MAG: YdjY domain-containing protein [Planctomycetota bacterium]